MNKIILLIMTSKLLLSDQAFIDKLYGTSTIQEDKGLDLMTIIMIVAGVIISIFLIIIVFKITKKLFLKTEKIIEKTIDEDIKPLIKEKRREINEEKMLKNKLLLDEGIITQKEYDKRKEKLLSKFDQEE